MCGGLRVSRCKAYNAATNRWVTTGGMSKDRHLAAASIVPTLGLFITGGWSGVAEGTQTSSVESTVDGANFRTDLASMPYAMQTHCQVTLDGDTVVVVGGWHRTAHRLRTVYRYTVRYV